MKNPRLYTLLYIIMGFVFSSALKAQENPAPVLSTTGGTYVRVEDKSQLKNNDVCLIAFAEGTQGSGYALYAMSTLSETYNNKFAAVAVQSTEGRDYSFYPTSITTVSKVNSKEPSYLPYEYVFEKKTDNAWRIKDIDGKYLKNITTSSNTNVMSLSENPNDKGVTFTIKDSRVEAPFMMQFYNSKTTSNSDGYLGLSGSTFSCSTSSKYVALYRKVVPETATLEMSEVGYATMYYGTKDVILPTGLQASTYTLQTSNDKMYLKPSHTYIAGDVIPAGVGVVLRGAAGTYNLTLNEPEENPTLYDNVLKGTDENMTVTDANCTFFMLSLNANGDPGSVGFYWGADGGAPFENKAHKAYLPIPNAPGAKATVIYIDGLGDNGDATKVQNISNGAITNSSQYDALGRIINSGSTTIRIKNGKKYLSR